MTWSSRVSTAEWQLWQHSLTAGALQDFDVTQRSSSVSTYGLQLWQERSTASRATRCRR
jgi:hypothetical protein